MPPDAGEPSAPSPSRAPSSGGPPAPASPAPASPLGRQLQQLGLFFTGASFLAASVAVSRRAVLRRRRDALPAFHTSNRLAPAPDAADRLGLAASALGLATLNVMSFGVLLVGGIAWGFDLCSVAELRARTRAALGRPGLVSRAATPAPNRRAEREMEDMMRSLMARLGLDATRPQDERPGPADAGATGEAPLKK